MTVTRSCKDPTVPFSPIYKLPGCVEYSRSPVRPHWRWNDSLVFTKMPFNTLQQQRWKPNEWALTLSSCLRVTLCVSLAYRALAVSPDQGGIGRQGSSAGAHACAKLDQQVLQVYQRVHHISLRLTQQVCLSHYWTLAAGVMSRCGLLSVHGIKQGCICFTFQKKSQFRLLQHEELALCDMFSACPWRDVDHSFDFMLSVEGHSAAGSAAL